MDGSRFDAWTRRGLGLTAAGLAASLSGVPGFGATDAEAKKKRCKKLQQACKPGAKKKRCCKRQGLLCEIVVGLEGRHCCLGWEPPAPRPPIAAAFSIAAAGRAMSRTSPAKRSNE